jgi:hypothetical protein
MNPSNTHKNPKRVLAGRLNRAKRKALTPEGIERLRQAAIAHRPWEHSTGPRTPEGKTKVAANGRSKQKGPESVRAAKRNVAALGQLLEAMTAARKALTESACPDPIDHHARGERVVLRGDPSGQLQPTAL